MNVLGIETSCDETAAAIITRKGAGERKILSNIIWSQVDEHALYGGVVPEIAARAHVAIIDKLIEQALKEANLSFKDIDAIAATAGPGLIGGLIVGLMTAKAIAFALNKPFIGVNHLEGHALSPLLVKDIPFPYLLLLVSGGHTQLVLVNDFADYERIGTTIDDALGEAFDKTAKLLHLSYPGGPAVEKAAFTGDPYGVALPRPITRDNRLNFSFSGLKTAVRQQASQLAPLTASKIADLCASFQLAVCDCLGDRVVRALTLFRERYPHYQQPYLVVAGGVAANKTIRQRLENICSADGFNFFAPPSALCTDNAAMIAWAGSEHLLRGEQSAFDLAPRSRWPLDEKTTPAYGGGRRGAKA